MTGFIATKFLPTSFYMDSRILFILKEKLIKEVTEKAAEMNFAGQAEKDLYINATIDAYLSFYTQALIEMIDDEAA